MMKGSHRIGIAAGSFVLSLPAFVAVITGTVLAYGFPVLSGYRGTPVQAILTLLKSFSGSAVLTELLLLIGHVAVFIYLLIRFARGLVLPAFAQLYCLAIVVFAIGERIRLEIVDVDVFFWFGALSLPHVLCLLALIYGNQRLPAVTLRAVSASIPA
jgi:hypothetical protein